MTLNEALDIVNSQIILIKAPNRYKEYEKYFLIFMHPEGNFDGIIAIDKEAKKVVSYSPMLFEPGEDSEPISQGKIDPDRDVIEHGRIKIEEYLKG